jgi:hypothetical protein
MNNDRWFKLVGFFTIIGAISAVMVVPEFRRIVGLDSHQAQQSNSSSAEIESKETLSAAETQGVRRDIPKAEVDRVSSELETAGKFKNYPELNDNRSEREKQEFRRAFGGGSGYPVRMLGLRYFVSADVIRFREANHREPNDQEFSQLVESSIKRYDHAMQLLQSH